ncbi:hypothetical protein EOD41_18230 [Mucilaginibacter limnophilus]|uniref:Putative auto-transporter adhesin head GIN domain-containing protein n=1 Tax=Mucilaginibacter limnophilus TaxID=1932778 RepID=A0A437MKA5_9SPHI|nr:DUF2807 domain-containing protein [Mucilaginibacter limnophilus]RVT98025.1 hypothetical protein EOD41_18230 [Mucilaginibacter limnophilus]
MKTTIITLATMLTLGLGTVNTVKADDNNDSAATVLTDVSNITKIEVRGNVELYVSDGSADQVKVYNRYYAENAMVQNKNGVLRIASYTNKKLVVWVTAKDVRAIAAYDNSTVKSFGKLSAIQLDVELHNTAAAKLDINSYSANITVADNAKADLTGNVNEYALNYGRSTSVNYGNLVAFNTARVVRSNDGYKVSSNELAVL